MSATLSHPGRSALISAAVAVVGAGALVWGVVDMQAHGRETPATAIAVAAGGLAAFFGALMVLNFLWAMRVVTALRSGRGVIARWTLTPELMQTFREADRARDRSEAVNGYRPPRRPPPAGVEVIFSQDGVLIGDTYAGLASSGLVRFEGLVLRDLYPPVLEVSTVLTRVTQRGGTVQDRGVLRIPVAPGSEDEAREVMRHFRDVLAARTIVNPGFWRGRMRIGQVMAAAGAASFGLGMLLRERNDQLSNVPLVLAVVGAVVALGGVVLFILARGFHRDQHTGR